MAKKILILAVMAALMLFSARASDPPFTRLELPGVQNLFSLGANIFSGSAPEGDEGFATLEKLGIKTIITVDGMKPDVERAHQHGMRYIHVPHGYDGIPTNVQAQLVKAAEVSAAPIFIHCHHGQHRGPAAAAIICMAEENWATARAEAWLAAAGTSTDYDGLFKSVREFKKPSTDEFRKIPAEFPETKEVSGLVDAMVAIDQTFDRMKSMRKAGYKATTADPDANAAHEMTILFEHFLEAQRLPEAQKRGPEFMAKLAAAEQFAKEARAAYQKYKVQRDDEGLKTLDAALDSTAKQCSDCHRAYRDNTVTVRLRSPSENKP
jgi:hypothetical protein